MGVGHPGPNRDVQILQATEGNVNGFLDLFGFFFRFYFRRFLLWLRSFFSGFALSGSGGFVFRRFRWRRYRNFGERNFNGNPEGVGWDLATCKRGEGAQDYFGENPDSNSYAY